MTTEAPRSKPTKGVKVDNSPTRCPYCHEDVQESAGVLVCSKCLGRHHSACWTERGGCSACTCDLPLEATEVTRLGNCGACGAREDVTHDCRECQSPTCKACLRKPFRRCVDCAEDLIRKERRYLRLKQRLQGHAFVGYFIGLVGIGFLVGSLHAYLDHKSPEKWAWATVVGAVLVIVAARSLWVSRALTPEADALEDELAPYLPPLPRNQG